MNDNREPSPPQDVTARLVILCRWLGLSENEMAARLGMAAATYRQWERRGGRQWRSIKPLKKVADAIGVSAAWLAYGPSCVPFAKDGASMPAGASGQRP
jgi:transcriptional regulator with XRE-family HTH domain